MQISLWHLCSIMVLHVVNEVSTCSQSCTCKWKNGKRTAECSGRTLTEIPNTIDPETQVLDFSDNNLAKLTKELFVKKQLVNLQRLYLSKCRIKTVHKDTFKGLTNLVEMDLSGNFLDTVPTVAFSNCQSLMKLTLSSNPIKDVKRLAFNHLSYLNTLELSGCEISEVQEGAFQGLHRLEWLYLSSNHLKTIDGPYTFPKTLKGVELHKNPWTCDCHIQDFRNWLSSFHIPLSSDPECKEPSRLRNVLVKNVPKEELACLPDVEPTTFYLELTEGKNVSLRCQIRAIPEATVSWWFDGQLLQNNTSVAPGMRLMYYIEEGTESKKSELFIYNANAEDNGTYVCHAENAAGSSQSNFTIKIVLKEEPIVIIVSFPLEYLMFAVIGVSVFALLVIMIVIVCVVKCHRRKKRQQKRDQTKEVSLHLQQAQNGGASEKTWTKSISSSPLDQQLKHNLTPTTQTTTCASEPEEMVLFGMRTCDDQFANNLSPLRNVNRTVSPLSLRRYQIEQNPDLINGTESIGCRRAGDGEDVRQGGEEENIIAPGVACIRSGAEFYTTDPSSLAVRHMVDAQNYPMDYGLPKIACRSACTNDAYYRTLPCNRMKRHSAANPLKRYSREVEFLSRSVDTPYDHYHTTDVRYTADGYPVPRQLPPPVIQPAGTPPSSMPCCSVNWPPCLPANPHSLPGVSKKCASAQTDTEDECDSISVSVSVVKSEDAAVNVAIDNVNEVLTESPDEGYEGEPSVV
ncbi:leucine-rich repeat-containing protein 24-like [Euwallacea fornicatus]|uniref:leucine-rich repeat-containing protein 24-like n=1 Tax=Euwallacea fornicatus TaxID=995702 RepID=UPI00338EFE45